MTGARVISDDNTSDWEEAVAGKRDRKPPTASEQDKLTEALEATFPASDPLAMTQPHWSPEHPGEEASQTGVEAELARQLTRRRPERAE
jgi:hypothetical protein